MPAEQVDAVEPGIGRKLVDLGTDGAELCGERCTDGGVRGLQRLAHQRLSRLHQLGDRGDAVVGGLDGVDAVRHGVEQVAQVAGAIAQALRRKEVDRIVESRIDPLAGCKLGLGGRDQVRRLLQLQKVRTDAGRKHDVSHRSTFLVQFPQRDLHVTIPGIGDGHPTLIITGTKKAWLTNDQACTFRRHDTSGTNTEVLGGCLHQFIGTRC